MKMWMQFNVIPWTSLGVDAVNIYYTIEFDDTSVCSSLATTGYTAIFLVLVQTECQ